MNKIDKTLISANSYIDKFEKFVEVYLTIAFACILISFLYNIIKRSL